MNALPTPWQVAVEFCRQLTAQLGEAKMDAVRWRNSREELPGVCHSHDFTDANMAMNDAFEKLGVDCDPQNAEHLELWNSAWNLAKGCDFRLEVPA